MPTILVTGAAGFIGSHTVDRLLTEGHTVVGLDNLRTGRLENLREAFLSPRFRFEQIDITEPGRLEAAVAASRPDVIIHLAGLVSVQESIQNPELNHRLNVRATELVIESAKMHHVPRVVYASSAAVYGHPDELPLRETSVARPVSPYGEAKLRSEELLRGISKCEGLTVICLRYFNVYGPRQDPMSPYSGVISVFLRQFAAGEAVTVYGDGEQTRDFVYVRDVAEANLLAAEEGNERFAVYNIGTGVETSINELLRILAEMIGRSIQPHRLPPRQGDIARSVAAVALAAFRLGFSSRTIVRQGLQQFLRQTANRGQ